MRCTPPHRIPVNVRELRQQAKARKIPKYYRMDKAQLLSALGLHDEAKAHKSQATRRKAVAFNSTKEGGDSSVRKAQVKGRILRSIKRAMTAKGKSLGRTLTQQEKRIVAAKALATEVKAIRAGQPENKPKRGNGQPKKVKQIAKRGIASFKRKPKPEPLKPKTHTDLINHGEKLIPIELIKELDRIRDSPEAHKYEAATSSLVALNQELKLTIEGKGKRSEAAIATEALVHMKQRTKYEQSLTKASELMNHFRQSLIDQSPISQSQADSMAAKIKIDKKAIKVIPEKDLRQQSAEFYRLTRGRGSGTIDSFTKTTDRACADKVKRLVNIGASGKKSTMFHEMAHHIEFGDPEIGNTALDWIRSRASGNVRKLKSLTGKSYRSSEIAYPDNFLSPYVGKVYAYKQGGQSKLAPITEVISMGVERFSDPIAMVNFYLKDPEHFKFVLGAIR